jgi:hypothetical protein
VFYIVLVVRYVLPRRVIELKCTDHAEVIETQGTWSCNQSLGIFKLFRWVNCLILPANLTKGNRIMNSTTRRIGVHIALAIRRLYLGFVLMSRERKHRSSSSLDG